MVPRCLPIVLLLAAICSIAVVDRALAQQADEETATPQVEEQTQSPPPAPTRDAGVFGKGRVRGSLILGWGNAYDQSYFLLGVGGGYFVADGVEVGMEVLAWLGKDPTMYQFTPGVRYVVWQLRKWQPYLGAFYRYTAIKDWSDQQSIGGRFGIMYRSGKGYFGVGGVYNRALDCDDRIFDCDTVYPEAFFALFW